MEAPGWVVAGAPGTGESTVAGLLAQRLRPAPARTDERPAAPHAQDDDRAGAPPLAAQVDVLLAGP